MAWFEYFWYCAACRFGFPVRDMTHVELERLAIAHDEAQGHKAGRGAAVVPDGRMADDAVKEFGLMVGAVRQERGQ
jgi:hypothetical protein